jgi:bifunctional non-homologous end joining protein LigD
MALTTYRKKRSFSKTPEPTGGKAAGQQLRFVIQKHDASHLHYDFRLEMEGVLKSWAVPKGPSTDPTVKRLAMMVEDHPYDYRSFEGVIPKGQYGGGTVIVWDEGVYEPAEGEFADKRSKEKDLLRQLHKGKIIITLEGKKLKGEYALVQSSYQGENSWLLMKVKDKYARVTDVTKKGRSVISGKTIAEMEKEPDKVYGKKNASAKTVPEKKAAVPKKKAAATKKKKAIAGKKSSFPTGFTPMLATLVDKPFEEPGWVYEIKWDGYRAVALMNGRKISLISRNNKSFNEKFYPVFEAIQQWGLHAVVDGEIVVINDQGAADFGSLQNWRSEADGALFYYVFDIVWLDGYDLTGLTLLERRDILKANLPPEGIIRMSETFDTSPAELLQAAGKMGLEGIMAKRADSEYAPGIRTREWLKIKTNLRHEVVIGGYTRNDGSSKAFSSLLVGVFEKGKLQYTGKIGTGFNQEQQQEMMQQFKSLVTKKSPFNTEPDINKPSRFRPDPPNAKATWLKPKLVCEVSYREVTSDGVMRHPSFEGMREDKKAVDVTREIPVTAAAAVKPEKKATRGSKEKLAARPGSKERKTLLNPQDKSQVREVGGHELQFTNLDKIYWPKEKITKRELVNYYYQAASYILPYLKGRPQSLNRFPNGINGKSFYQKDVTGKIPGWIDTFPYRSQEDNQDKNFMVCNDEATLLYMANLGCIEINPWSSTVKEPDNPDWCIIDLDPGKRTGFEQVIEAAQVTHEVLEKAGIPCYPKTSGSTGIHIYIPLGAAYTYEHSKEFARLIVTIVHNEIPDFTSIERVVSGRKGKMYLDFLQNRPQATLAAPYSVRPKPGATVSMPLRWDEVKKGLTMQDFTIHNTIGLLKERGDLFKPVLGKGINMAKAIEKLEKI